MTNVTDLSVTSDPESNLNSTLKPESDGSAGLYPDILRDVSEMEIDEKTVLERQYHQPQAQTSFETPRRSSGHPPANPGPRDYHGRQGPHVLLDQVHQNLNQSPMHRGGHQNDPGHFQSQYQTHEDKNPYGTPPSGGHQFDPRQNQPQYQPRDCKNRSGTPPSVDDDEAEDTIVANVVVDKTNPLFGNERSNMFGTTTSESFQYTRQPSTDPQPQHRVPGQRRISPNQPQARDDHDYQRSLDINGSRQRSGLAPEHPIFDDPPNYEIVMSPRPLQSSPSPSEHRQFQGTNISRLSPTQRIDRPITPPKVSSDTDPRINEPLSSDPQSIQENNQTLSPPIPRNGQPVAPPRPTPRPRRSTNTSVNSEPSSQHPPIVPTTVPVPQDNDYKIKYEQAIRTMKKMQNELNRTRDDAQRQIQWERQSSARLNCKKDFLFMTQKGKSRSNTIRNSGTSILIMTIKIFVQLLGRCPLLGI